MPPKMQPPDPAQADDLTAALQSRIAAEGALTVADYMQAVAAHYYAHARPFGASGDFTTAPEISQMFGEVIAAWCMDVWTQAGNPAAVNLIELGPGRGTLMADICRTVRQWPNFQAAMTVHLVETSPQLRQIQTDILSGIAPVWHDDVSALPQGFSIIVANEFFDALPIRQLIRCDGVWHERAVGFDGNTQKLFWTTVAAKDATLPPFCTAAKDGDILEQSPASIAVARTLAAHIAAQGGACLVADYGYTQAALGDTLQAVSRHQYADVLSVPGTQDITAHVDFDTLAQSVSDMVDVCGVMTQGRFLTALGIVQRAAALVKRAATPQDGLNVTMALHRLTAPSAMGDLFKVMAWTAKDSGIQPAGF